MPDWKGNESWLMKPGVLAKNEPATWTDWEGQQYKTPRRTLNFACWLHARLRDHVWRRDGYRCQACGDLADSNGIISTGATRSALCIDHVVARRNGGGNHPDNLQSLCRSCNSAKAGLVDKTQPRKLVPFKAEFAEDEFRALDAASKRLGLTQIEALRAAVRRQYVDRGQS